MALLVGCSKLSGPKGQPVALEVLLPVPPAVETDDTLQLRARAIDENGDSVGAAIYWRVADTTLVLVDSSGLVTTALTTGSGRVQAHVGSLYSSLSSGQLTIRPRSDSLLLTPPDTLVVAAGDTASASLVATVLSINPVGGVSGTTILFEVDPADQSRVADTAHFAGGLTAVRVTTGSTGAPVSPVTLRRRTATWTDTIHVRVSASRPSGAKVPGSDSLFTILFQ
jgi:hypothetical protein